MLLCNECSADATLICQCQRATYCSPDCAEKQWPTHSAVCVSIADDLVPNCSTESDRGQAQRMLNALMQDAEKSEGEFRQVFRDLYPVANYPYFVLHYDRTRSQILLPLVTYDQRDVAVANLSAPQRLSRDRMGPWSGARSTILKLPTGFGKTALGHAILSNYRYERVAMPVLDAWPEAKKGGTQPRILLWVTKRNLMPGVLGDVWAQEELNPESVRCKIEEAGKLALDRDEQPARFDKINIVTYRQFSNLLQGKNAAGRKLWAGFALDERVDKSTVSVDSKIAGTTRPSAPTAYRQVVDESGTRWVRGRAPHNYGDTTKLRNLELRFGSKNLPNQLEDDITAVFQTADEAFAALWRKNVPGDRRRQLVKLHKFYWLQDGSFKIEIEWRYNDVPTAQEWEQWVGTVFSRSRVKDSVQELGLTEVIGKRAVSASVAFERALDAEDFGFRLSRQGNSTKKYKWEPASLEEEIDYNPLNRMAIVFDEADLIFDPQALILGERPDTELITTALKEAPNVVTIWMSATIDMLNGLGILNAILPNDEQALAPSLNLPFNRQLPTFYDKKSLEYESLLRRLDSINIVQRSGGEPKPLKDIFVGERNDDMKVMRNLTKGLISVAEVQSMRDLFAELIIPADNLLRYRASAQLEAEVASFLKETKEVHEKAVRDAELDVQKEKDPARRAVLESILASVREKTPYPNHNRLMELLAVRGELQPGYRIYNREQFAKTIITDEAIGLVEGEDPVVPVARTLLLKLRQLDREEVAEYGELTNRAVLTSVRNGENGILPVASAMQACGYQWVSVEKNPLTEAQRRERNKLRRNGESIPQDLLLYRIRDEAFTAHNSALKSMYGPDESADGRVQFIVLSEQLFAKSTGDRDLTQKQGDEIGLFFRNLVLENLQLSTGYAFSSKVGDLRRAGFEVEARNSAPARLRSLLAGKQLYFWPGTKHVAERAEEWDANEALREALQNEEQEFFFVRSGRGPMSRIFVLEPTVRVLTMDGLPDDEQAYSWHTDEFDVRFGSPAEQFSKMLTDKGKLSDQQRQDAIRVTLDWYNSTSNARGERSRFVLIGGEFAQGINIFRCTKGIAVEPAPTRSLEVQRRGRLIRRGGHSGLPFERWTYTQYTCVLEFDKPVKLSKLSNRAGTGAESFKAIQRAVISTVDHNPIEEPTDADLEREFVQSFGEFLPGGAENPVYELALACYKKDRRQQNPLQRSSLLQPYQMVRVLAEDPRVTAFRLHGERVFDSWAVDKQHNEIKDEATDGYNPSDIAKLTNYCLLRQPLLRRIEELRPQQPDSAERLENLLSIFVPKSSSAEEMRIYGTREVKSIYRNLAEERSERYLYIQSTAMKTRDRLYAADFGHNDESTLLEYLVHKGYAAWCVHFDDVAGSSINSPIRFGGISASRPRYFIGDEDAEEVPAAVTVGLAIEQIELPDEEQEAIERQQMENLHQLALQVKESLGFGWPEWLEIDEGQNPLDYLLYLHSKDRKSARFTVLEKRRARAIKRLIVDIYKHGSMNWFYALQILCYSLDGLIYPENGKTAPGTLLGREEFENSVERFASGLLRTASTLSSAGLLRILSKYRVFLKERRDWIMLVVHAGDWVRATSTDSEPRYARTIGELEQLLDYYAEFGVNVVAHLSNIVKAGAKVDMDLRKSVREFLALIGAAPILSRDSDAITSEQLREVLEKTSKSSKSKKQALIELNPEIVKRNEILRLLSVEPGLVDALDSREYAVEATRDAIFQSQTKDLMNLIQSSLNFHSSVDRTKRVEKIYEHAVQLYESYTDEIPNPREFKQQIGKRLREQKEPAQKLAAVERVDTGFTVETKYIAFDGQQVELTQKPVQKLYFNTRTGLKIYRDADGLYLDYNPPRKARFTARLAPSLSELYLTGLVKYESDALLSVEPVVLEEILRDITVDNALLTALRESPQLMLKLMNNRVFPDFVRALRLAETSDDVEAALGKKFIQTVDMDQWAYIAQLFTHLLLPGWDLTVSTALWEISDDDLSPMAQGKNFERREQRLRNVALLHEQLKSYQNYLEAVDDLLAYATNLRVDNAEQGLWEFVDAKRTNKTFNGWAEYKKALKKEFDERLASADTDVIIINE